MKTKKLLILISVMTIGIIAGCTPMNSNESSIENELLITTTSSIEIVISSSNSYYESSLINSFENGSNSSNEEIKEDYKDYGKFS